MQRQVLWCLPLRLCVRSMTDLTPADLTEGELYRLLTENPDKEEFTPADLRAVRED